MSQHNHELGVKELVLKYPDYPRITIIKIDTGFRGVDVTQKALQWAKVEGALFDIGTDQGEPKPRFFLGSVLFRDGSLVRGLDSVTVKPNHLGRKGSPYTLDVVDGQLWLLDGEEQVEPVYLSTIPKFYGKKTSRGTPMSKVISGGSNVLFQNVYGYCYFWKQKLACQYCGSVQIFLRNDEAQTKDTLEDLYETVTEALKEEGRWTSVGLVVGSDPRGDQPYDKEVGAIVEVLKVYQRAFGSKKFTARLVSSAVPKEQLLRYRDAGATAVEPHLEVWNKKLFETICPGKTKYYGWDYWVQSAIDAVGVFGRGNVCSQFVCGAELSQPHGFKDEEEALASNFEGAEYFARHGVTTSANILRLAKGSLFFAQGQKHPSLEYVVRLTKGLHEIRRKYQLGVGHNDFKRCGIHPDTDLARLFNHEVSEEPVLAGV
jgi:hypothetical protein